ncbi:hypothetical protein TNCV_3028101 [Trichonephila clavipes]|nr:hypothetical protein TNCV_3028101 [Trichonephila clavipes]
MRSLRQKKEGVIDTLRQRGYNIIQMLEHDFVHLKKTENFQEFLLQHEVTDRLNPRCILVEGPMEFSFLMKDVRNTLISPVCILGLTNTVTSCWPSRNNNEGFSGYWIAILVW